MSSTLDCLAVDCGRVEPPPVPAPRSYASVDLMAKDFDSLLRAMLDQLQQLAPDWGDRSEADLGMVLLELFAYAGDQMSYLQDRVALEGFLRTATQTESVRKLLRLIDYTMYPGHAAETFVVFECVGAAPLFLPSGFAISTGASGDADAVIYETVEDALVFQSLSTIALSVDAPSTVDGLQAVLAANLAGTLSPGQWLLFQQGDAREWAQVATCAFAAAATTVTLATPLANTFTAGGDAVAGVPATTVNGNRAPATHGTTYIVEQTGSGQAQQAVLVDLAPITWVLDPVSDQPVSTLAVTVDGVLWVEVEDLIDSDAASQQYRTSRDNDGYVTVHFGDDEFGAAPPLGAPIVVRCRIGIGNAGHVARDTLTEFDSSLSPGITLVRNPLAASQPREPQSLAQAKLVGPAQLRVQNRAVVPEDFEALVAGGVRVNAHVVAPLQSKARMTHTGSWNTVVVSVDMPDRQPIDTATRSAFESFLETKKMAGLDVQVEDARYCPVHIALRVDVEAEHFARDVRGAVERALVGTHARGFAFFDPGRLTFGQPVYLSDLYGAVMAVPGVSAVAVTRFKRLGDRYPDNEAQGFIPVGALEVARLDNDPSAPQFGVLYVRTCGGKEG